MASIVLLFIKLINGEKVQLEDVAKRTCLPAEEMHERRYVRQGTHTLAKEEIFFTKNDGAPLLYIASENCYLTYLVEIENIPL